mgnify:CR=1 FL=1
MKFYKMLLAVVLIFPLWSISCKTLEKQPQPSDAVSGATPHYAGGDRGALPPTAGEYTVLGVREGIKAWVIQYDEKLLRGGEFFDDSAAKALAEWGVKTVISISPNNKERAFCRKHSLELVEIPFDKKNGPSKADIQKFLNTIKQGKAPFYLHCIGGTHRAGVLGVAYRIHRLGWAPEKALVEFGRLGGNLKDDHTMLESVLQFKP